MKNRKLNKYFEYLKSNSFLLNHRDGPFKIITNPLEIENWQKERSRDPGEAVKPSAWLEIGNLVDDPYIVLLRDLVEFPDGHRGGYFRLLHRGYLENGTGGVAILCERNKKFLLLHHFRHATRSWHWEIPKGYGESGISAEEQARIEIKEEVGSEVYEIIDLGIFYCNTGIEGNPVSLFLARISAFGQLETQAGIYDARWVSAAEFESMIANSEIDDGFTMTIYARAKSKKLI